MTEIHYSHVMDRAINISDKIELSVSRLMDSDILYNGLVNHSATRRHDGDLCTGKILLRVHIVGVNSENTAWVKMEEHRSINQA